MLKRCLKLYLIVLSCDPRRKNLMPTSSLETLISQALELNKFKVYDVGDDMKFVRPSRGQTLQLTYFQNNILHLFALPALIANILIRNGHIMREDVITNTRSLFYFLKHELFAPVREEELDHMINKYINAFVTGGYITELENHMLTLSGDGFEELLILSSSIRLNLVRYLIAVSILRQTGDGMIQKQEFIDTCVDLCKKVPSDITNNSPEFADPIMFNIMCDTFIRHNYFEYHDDQTICPHQEKIIRLAHAAEPLLAAKLVRHLKREIAEIKISNARRRTEKAAADAAAQAAQRSAETAARIADGRASAIRPLRRDLSDDKAAAGAASAAAGAATAGQDQP